MESLVLAHHSTVVHIALFNSLQEPAQLRSRLVKASTLPSDEAGDAERAALDFAFVDASMVTSRLHLLTAINQALLARSDNSLKTKTVHSEVLFFLEPGTNITESLKHFGLSGSTSSLVLVRIAPLGPNTSLDEAQVDEGKVVLHAMEAIVNGQLASLDLLGNLPDGGTNDRSLRKIYKLNQDVVLSETIAGTPEVRQALDALCTGAVALKVVT